MKYSKLFGKTIKSAKEHKSLNATLLTKGGFIDQTMAGVYTFLPLGLRVLTKIEAIVREEMNNIGQEVFMPAVVPTELWETTGRISNFDVLTKVSPANKFAQAQNDANYILSPTHEEVVTPLAKKFNPSYKDLPFAVYQIQSKFRNEIRPKSGLLRGREFRMKDLYSFHVSLEDFNDFYENSKKYYQNVFDRLGIGDQTVIALASGGAFSKEYSHEFQTKCEDGEDLIFYDSTNNIYYNKEVAPSAAIEPDWDTTQKPMEAVYGENITGMDALVAFLGLPAQKCAKTLIYETNTGETIVAAVRGDYDINELKLRNEVGCDSVVLADEQKVQTTTGAILGYAGLIGLPQNLRVFVDNSLEKAVNFECGANKDNYHNVNVNWDRDLPRPTKFYDIKTARTGDINPASGKAYETFAASEVGNIFTLGTKYTDTFGYTYTNEDGEQKPIYMGCYGLGTSRVMGVIVEVCHDEKGVIWPESVAPFKFHVIGLNLETASVMQKASSLYENLCENKCEVLFDDRLGISAGEKFADADLIGCPYRIVVSAKTEEVFEVKKRTESEPKSLTLEQILAL